MESVVAVDLERLVIVFDRLGKFVPAGIGLPAADVSPGELPGLYGLALDEARASLDGDLRRAFMARRPVALELHLCRQRRSQRQQDDRQQQSQGLHDELPM